MESTTILLAQFMGPVLLAAGVGIFLSRDYYMKVYRHFENETLAVMMGGIVALAAGIAVVLYHNAWATIPEVLVSLLGWVMVLKGFMLLAFPKTVNRFGDAIVKTNTYFTVAAIFALVVGGYLSWIAFFA